MPRKSRKKVQHDTPATEPTPVAAVLEQSPIAAILADPNAGLVTADQLPIPSRSPAPAIENVVAEALLESQKPKGGHVDRLTGLRPAPSGFVGLESFKNAGIRLSRSLDKNVVAIQFADDRRPSRDGLNPENQRLMDRGFSYRPERAQWERVDRERPAENYQDAKAFVAMLVNDRLAVAGADVGRS
jgi:hypothetical protein